jgi:hypothetical protein
MRKTKKGKEDELAPQRTQDSQEERPALPARRDLPLPLVRQNVPHAPRLALLRPVQSKRGGVGGGGQVRTRRDAQAAPPFPEKHTKVQGRGPAGSGSWPRDAPPGWLRSAMALRATAVGIVWAFPAYGPQNGQGTRLRDSKIAAPPPAAPISGRRRYK